MKQLVVDFMPPILMRMLRRVAQNVQKTMTDIDGYQNRDIIDLILFKNLSLRSATKFSNIDAQSIRTIAAVGMAIENNSKVNVLDFGGGAGHHQFVAKSIFKKVKFGWTVVETEKMCAAAQSKIVDLGLEFIPNLNNLTKNKFFDLIFSNSAIQYTENPIETLRNLVSLDFNVFYITRIPLASGENTITYFQESLLSQNGPGLPPENFNDKRVRYAINIVSKEAFEKTLNENLEHWTTIDEGPWDPERFGNEIRTYTFIGFGKKLERPL